MGFLIKWDITGLVEKMARLRSAYGGDETVESDDDDGTEPGEVKKKITRKATFLTGTTVNLEVHEDDVVFCHRFRAHKDMCNSITYVSDLNLIATCGFDCNVYMFEKEEFKRVGSLVMGTGQQAAEMSEYERRKYSKIW